ncbi:hypothetical protein Tco_0652680 [Tanacetum coccineum]|uniref:Uncharacterized protein n=1 Tax=Tanacetum coccineum TaxID=301880 RepID=A0ABQ4WY94_9ASTR
MQLWGAGGKFYAFISLRLVPYDVGSIFLVIPHCEVLKALQNQKPEAGAKTIWAEMGKGGDGQLWGAVRLVGTSVCVSSWFCSAVVWQRLEMVAVEVETKVVVVA